MIGGGYSYRNGSFEEGKLEVGEEFQHFLLLEVAHIADYLRLLVLAFAPHAFLHAPFLVDLFGFFVLLQDELQLLDVQLLGRRHDREEELVVDEDDGLCAFLSRRFCTTMGVRLVLMFEK